MRRLVLLRAQSGPEVGIGHVVRSCSVAEEILRLGGDAVVIVDDAATAEAFTGRAVPVCTVEQLPDWTGVRAVGAWLDGRCDWTTELERLAARGTPALLVENRGPARDHLGPGDRLVYPALHYTPDPWDEGNRGRILAGPGWVPLASDLLRVRAEEQRDIDLLITFGGSDPFRLTERVLAALGASDERIVVAVGVHMAHRRDTLLESLAEFPDLRVLLPGLPIGPWIARSRAAVTAVGTTLYELAYLDVPALILANYESDREALEWYRRKGPHLPLGVAGELSAEGLRAALCSGRARLAERLRTPIPELGSGATRLAQVLLGTTAA